MIVCFFIEKITQKHFQLEEKFELEKKSIENELRIPFINLARGDS